MNDNAIALTDVHVSLGSGAARVDILRGLDLNIGQGETIAILGPSGSGKSTLLMVMAGLERADSGSIEIAGARIDAMGEDELARFRGRHLGIVFQSFNLIPTMTALENVAVPLELAGRGDAFEAAREQLARVGLKDRMAHYPGELSGGEQQRVAIARAMAPRPPIVFADEPTGNLDAATGGGIADLIFSLNADDGATLVLVTHDPALAERCGRVVTLGGGAIAGDERRRKPRPARRA
ncbi:MAG: ABC transporter ATP-binding protein [Flavobacteriaceae bacterium]